jgi:hypothetical protein
MLKNDKYVIYPLTRFFNFDYVVHPTKFVIVQVNLKPVWANKPDQQKLNYVFKCNNELIKKIHDKNTSKDILNIVNQCDNIAPITNNDDNNVITNSSDIDRYVKEVMQRDEEEFYLPATIDVDGSQVLSSLQQCHIRNATDNNKNFECDNKKGKNVSNQQMNVEEDNNNDNNNQNNFGFMFKIIMNNKNLTTLQRDDNKTFILDSGASIHVFNDIKCIEKLILLTIQELHNDIKNNQIQYELNGISGGPILASHKGYIQGLGEFLIVSEAKHNLISIPTLMKLDLYEISFVDKYCQIRYISTQNNLINCPLSDSNLFMINDDQLSMLSRLEQYTQEVFSAKVYTAVNNVPKSVVANDVISVESFTKEHISRAKKVILLHNALDHPSNHVLKNALNNNLIIGSCLNSKDVNNCFKYIW